MICYLFFTKIVGYGVIIRYCRDEILTSISKLFGVPILEIATADKDIADGDLVFEGHHLDIPSPVITYAQVVRLC